MAEPREAVEEGWEHQPAPAVGREEPQGAMVAEAWAGPEGPVARQAEGVAPAELRREREVAPLAEAAPKASAEAKLEA